MSPKVPTFWPLKVVPRASQQSSTEPEVVLFAEGGDGFGVEGVAESVGDHDGAGLFAAGLFEPGDVDLEGGEGDVDEDGDEAVLQDGVDGGREAGGYGDDFHAGFELAVEELGAGERGEGDEVGGGAGVDEGGGAEAEEAG